jgi:hypothetical protein
MVAGNCALHHHPHEARSLSAELPRSEKRRRVHDHRRYAAACRVQDHVLHELFDAKVRIDFAPPLRLERGDRVPDSRQRRKGTDERELRAVSRHCVEQRLRTSPSVRERISRVGDVRAQRTWRRRVNDEIMPGDPRVELAGSVVVALSDTYVETAQRGRRVLARRRRHAKLSCDELAHHGLSRVASCAEYDGCLRSRHFIQRRRSAKEFR